MTLNLLFNVHICQVYLFTGKTLILEAAAKMLSEREDTEVVFICALDYKKNDKKSDDILDIMLR